MSQKHSLDPNNATDADDHHTPDRKPPPGNVFSPIPLLSPSRMTFSGADDSPFIPVGGADSTDLFKEMSQEELSMMADATAPFQSFNDTTGPTASVNHQDNTFFTNPNASVNHHNMSSPGLVIPPALTKHLSVR